MRVRLLVAVFCLCAALAAAAPAAVGSAAAPDRSKGGYATPAMAKSGHALPAVAEGGYAVLAPGSLYAGRFGPGVETQLRLLGDGFFVLTQTRPKGDKSPALCLTGRWRQTDGGALLQLSNNHGLALRFNVGGGGSLYGTSVGRPGLPPQSLALHKRAYAPASFTLMGRLEFHDGQARLIDSASDVVFAPVTGKDVDALDKQTSLFVEAEVTLQKRGLRVERLRSTTERGPDAATPTDERFADAAGKGVWLAPPLPGVPATACFFHPTGEGKGTVEITGPGIRLTATYREMSGQKLLFRVSEAEARNAEAGGAGALLDIFRGEAVWKREAAVLLLRATNGRSLQLERAGGRR